MRRTLEKAEIIKLLKTNYIGQLGYIAGSTPFIVPITYYYDPDNNNIISYSSIGHKMNSMRKKPTIVLGVQQIDSVANWQSIQVHGTFKELSGIDSKHALYLFAEGVKNIIKIKNQDKSHFISDFSAKIDSEKVPITFRIDISEMNGVLRESSNLF